MNIPNDQRKLMNIYKITFLSTKRMCVSEKRNNKYLEIE